MNLSIIKKSTAKKWNFPKKDVVMIIGPSLDALGGVTTHIHLICSSELTRSFKFVHFQVGSEGRDENSYSKLLRLAISPFELIFKILTVKPDIVHFNTSMDNKAFWRDIIHLLISKCFRLRTVFQIHGGAHPQFFFKNRLMSFFGKRMLQLPDALVVLAQSEKLSYQRFAPLKRLALIPNAIQTSQFGDMLKKKFDAETLKIVYLGRLQIEKGLLDVIEAFKILKEDKAFSKFHFDIAGSGSDETFLKKKVSDYQLSGQITFHGPVFGVEKYNFWQSAHIFVFPSYSEGFPYTLLESLCSGTPLITTRVGGIPDAVKENIHGLFVKPRDPEALANVIKKMESDRNLLKKMSKNCIEKAYSFYSIERLSNQFLELYLDILR